MSRLIIEKFIRKILIYTEGFEKEKQFPVKQQHQLLTVCIVPHSMFAIIVFYICSPGF